MENLFSRIKLWGKEAVSMATSNLISTVIITLLAFSNAPALTIMIGVGVNAAVSFFRYSFKETFNNEKLLKSYADQIAYKLGKDVEELQISDLQTIAYGDANKGIQPNPILAQQMEKNKTDRNISFFTRLASAAVFIAGVLIFPGYDATTIFNTGNKMAEALAAGATVIGSSAVLSQISDHLFKNNANTINDNIMMISRQIRKGKLVTKSKVMDLAVATNPMLDEYIEENYDCRYFECDRNVREALTQSPKIEEQFNVGELTSKINRQEIKANTLAFALAGDDYGEFKTEQLRLVEEKAKRRDDKIKALEEGRNEALEESAAKEENHTNHPNTDLQSPDQKSLQIRSDQTLKQVRGETSKPASDNDNYTKWVNYLEKRGIEKHDPTQSHTDRVKNSREHSKHTEAELT